MATGKAASKAKEQPRGDEDEARSLVVAGVGGALPASLDDEVEGLEGYGYSERAEDSLIPILSILQDNSAEAKRGHSRYIQGALGGNLIIRALKRVVDVSPDSPLVVQPCGFQHMWVRWMGEPGEGQVIGQYPFEDRPAEAESRKLKEDDDRETWVMPDGSRLVDTRYHYCFVKLDDRWVPMVIPFAGTNHTVSRTWTNIMKAMELPNHAKAPAWFRAYAFVTKFNERGAQSWYTYEFKDLGWIGDRSQRDAGRELFESVNKQIVSADIRSEDQTGGNSDNKDDVPI